MLTHGSLFAGIGGFDLGFERAGIKTVWQVEIDPFCRRVLRRHFQVAQFDDVQVCWAWDAEGFRVIDALPIVDVITGGFPCQDVSAANFKGEGLDGQRSGLWFEYLRIISELRPKFVVVENVANLLNRGIERVVGSLAEIGYDAEWEIISAAAVGAHHLRERIWIVAYPNRDQHETHTSANEWQATAQLSADAESNLRRASRDDRSSAFDRCRASLGHANSERLAKRVMRRRIFSGAGISPARQALSMAGDVCDSASKGLPDWAGGTVGQPQPITEFERPSGREIERDFRGVAHGVSRRVDRLRSLGNSIVPQIAEWIGRRIVACHEQVATGDSAVQTEPKLEERV